MDRESVRVTHVPDDTATQTERGTLMRLNSQLLLQETRSMGGPREPLTLGLKASIWGSLGSTTEGYGSKMTTFLGDSSADLHMDTSRSTTLKHTQNTVTIPPALPSARPPISPSHGNQERFRISIDLSNLPIVILDKIQPNSTVKYTLLPITHILRPLCHEHALTLL